VIETSDVERLDQAQTELFEVQEEWSIIETLKDIRVRLHLRITCIRRK
jgi:hypothetical protein